MKTANELKEISTKVVEENVQNQIDENNYLKGILVGFAVSTIVWCFLWSFVIGKIDKVHKQELNYVIEKNIKQSK
jgi:serine-rich repeat adhesion-like glycoprotein